jgi:hypothetical protein
MNLIFQGDIDTGFLFIYNAMEGDKASYRAMGQADRYKQAPAYRTATIVDNPENALYETVVGLAENQPRFFSAICDCHRNILHTFV